jgi:hypothetical protein
VDNPARWILTWISETLPCGDTDIKQENNDT